MAENVSVWRNSLLNDAGDITFQDLPVQLVPDDINTAYQYFIMLANDSLPYQCLFRHGICKNVINTILLGNMTCDGISAVFRNRFLSILSNIDFVDNIGITNETKTITVVGKKDHGRRNFLRTSWLSHLKNFIPSMKSQLHSTEGHS